MTNTATEGGDASETPKGTRGPGGASVAEPGDKVRSPGYIYLIHLDEGMKVRTEANGRIVYACHYIGWTQNHNRRLAAHAAGRGSRFMAEVERRRISWRVVRVWEGTRNDERKIKNRREAPRFCPVCVAERESSRGLLSPGLPEIQLGGSQMDVKKFVKKPVKVEAVRIPAFPGDDGVPIDVSPDAKNTIGQFIDFCEEIADWCEGTSYMMTNKGEMGTPRTNGFSPLHPGPHIVIPTIDGRAVGFSGDWIVKDGDGNFYHCRSETFETAYCESSSSKRNERILIVESSSPEFADVSEIVGGSIHIADADLVLVVSGEDGQAIKHRDRLPEEVDVRFARRSLAERLGDTPAQRVMDEGR